MKLSDFEKDFEKWNSLEIMFSGEVDMKTSFAMYLIKKYYEDDELNKEVKMKINRNRDGSGPDGKGPKTGRKQGNC